MFGPDSNEPRKPPDSFDPTEVILHPHATKTVPVDLYLRATVWADSDYQFRDTILREFARRQGFTVRSGFWAKGAVLAGGQVCPQFQSIIERIRSGTVRGVVTVSRAMVSQDPQTLAHWESRVQQAGGFVAYAYPILGTRQLFRMRIPHPRQPG